MQRKKKCTVTLENGRMPEKMAGWNSCSSWSTHKTLFHMRRLITIISLAGCVWFEVILHLFLSILLSLESCRSVCENSSFVILPGTLNQISPSILLTTRNYLLDDISPETSHLNERGEEYDTNEKNLNSVLFIESCTDGLKCLGISLTVKKLLVY